MNVPEQAYKVGIALRKTEIGGNFFKLFEDVKNQLSEFAFSQFTDLINNTYNIGFGKHFYGLNIALDIFQQNKDNPIFEGIVKEMFENKALLDLATVSEKLGNELELTCTKLMNDEIVRNFGSSTQMISKLKRSLQDTQVQIQRTGIIEWVQFNREIILQRNIIKEFEDNRSKLIFTEENRALIKEISNGSDEENFLKKFMVFSDLHLYIKQLIFEAFMGWVTEVDEKECVAIRVKKFEELALISFKTYNLIQRDSFIVRFKLNNSYRYGLIKRGNIKFDNDSEYIISRYTAKLFPINDTDYFRKG